MYQIIFITQFTGVPFKFQTKEQAQGAVNEFVKGQQQLSDDQSKNASPIPLQKFFFCKDDDGNTLAMVSINSVIGFYINECAPSESWRG